MCGEWTFDIRNVNKQTFPLQKYQAFLLQLAREEEIKVEHSYNETNVFAHWSYPCRRHKWHHGNASWSLYWDPTRTLETQRTSDVHARCAPGKIKTVGNKIQRRLVEAFPIHFKLEYDNHL